MSPFSTITSIGGLLPTDLLSRVAAGDPKLPGIDATDYGLVPGERLNDHITRSWNRLQGLWVNFQRSLAELPETDRTATSLTRERWLLPLLDELGFGGLPVAKAREVGGKEYAISHDWGGQVPIHLPGARIAVDRRTPGVPGAATTSPHGLVQEYLNRSDDNLWGLVSNGLVLRLLRDNASLTRQAYVEFELEAIFDGEAFSDFVVLWLTCHRTRFEGDQPEKCVLEQWSQEAATAGTRALDKLRDGVEAAITALGEGFIAHPGNTELREQLRSGELSTIDYQRQLLRTVYRLLFLLVAESRDLLLDPDADETAKERYRRFYGIDRLRTLATARRGSTHDDLWESLEVVIGALHRTGASTLGLAPLGSFLWSPDATTGLVGCRLQNRAFLGAIRALTLVRDDESQVHRAVDYRNLGAEELGSIYESLLELHAEVDPDARRFRLDTAAGNERKTTGSYYTPTSLITELLDSALDPVLEEAAHQDCPEAAILGLSVMDMAAGSGHFLIAAANRIAQRLASVRAGGIEPAPDEVRHALRDVVSHCIYGIDINPMAVELCKVNLWLEAMEPGKPLSFLDHRIVCGNALLGATPRLLAEGIPDDAYSPLLGDEKSLVAALKKRNRAERKGQLQLGFMPASVAELARPVAETLAAIASIDDDSVDALVRKQRLLDDFTASDAAARARLAADAWCAAFVCPKTPGEPEITTDTVRRIAEDPSRVSSDVLDRVQELAAEYRFLHLHLTFPNLYAVPDDPDTAENPRTGWTCGASIELGNPPWERVKLQEKEFFAQRDPEIAGAPNAAARKKLINMAADNNPALWEEFRKASRNAEGQSHFLRSSGRYPLCGRGDVNTYAVFAEAIWDAMSAAGRAGVILPLGIATDHTTRNYFAHIMRSSTLASLLGFENEGRIFRGVHNQVKFCLLTLQGQEAPGRTTAPSFAFFVREVAQLRDPSRVFELTATDVAVLNPVSLTCPTFRTRRDADLTLKVYGSEAMSLLRELPGFGFSRMFDMANDSDKFASLDFAAAPVQTHGDLLFVQLYEGKMVHGMNHRFGTYEGQTGPQARKGVLPRVGDDDLANSAYVVRPKYWVAEHHLPEPKLRIGYRRMTRSVDERTLICTAVPPAAISDTLALVEVDSSELFIFTLGVMNSLLVDFVLRQKHASGTLGAFVLEQLPLPKPTAMLPFADESGAALSIAAFVEPRALELCFSSWDLEAPMKMAGVDGAPFVFDRSRRLILSAEIDAALMCLVDLDLDEVEHLVDSFFVLQRKETSVHGEFLTRRLIIESFTRIAAAKESGVYESLLDSPPAHPTLRHDIATRPAWAALYLRLAEESAIS